MKTVEIYTWSYCPYCIKAKNILETEKIDYIEYEISDDKSKLHDLKLKSGSGTVPQIFVNGEFIGGCDDLVNLKKLDKIDQIFK